MMIVSNLLPFHIGLFLFTFLYSSEQQKNPEVHTVTTTSSIEDSIVLIKSWKLLNSK